MLAYISWNPSLSVGVDEIDSQHVELYKRLNSFLEAVANGYGRLEAEPILKFLVDYCLVHFGAEEFYMKNYNYPGYAFHKTAHEGLTDSVLDMVEQVNAGIAGEHVLTLTENLGDWVGRHIQKMDKMLGVYLREIGQDHALPPGKDAFVGAPEHDGPELRPSREDRCSYAGQCLVLFERFRDPASRTFWSSRYCHSSLGKSCERRKLMDEGAIPTRVPITMLPDGNHLAILAW
jgi:hemerythrin